MQKGDNDTSRWTTSREKTRKSLTTEAFWSRPSVRSWLLVVAVSCVVSFPLKLPYFCQFRPWNSHLSAVFCLYLSLLGWLDPCSLVQTAGPQPQCQTHLLERKYELARFLFPAPMPPAMPGSLTASTVHWLHPWFTYCIHGSLTAYMVHWLHIRFTDCIRSSQTASMVHWLHPRFADCIHLFACSPILGLASNQQGWPSLDYLEEMFFCSGSLKLAWTVHTLVLIGTHIR